MGAAESDVAIEAAHIALMREDWTLVPELFTVTRRTMRVVRRNIGFTALYNMAGLTLAALGLLPPIFALPRRCRTWASWPTRRGSSGSKTRRLVKNA